MRCRSGVKMGWNGSLEKRLVCAFGVDLARTWRLAAGEGDGDGGRVAANECHAKWIPWRLMSEEMISAVAVKQSAKASLVCPIGCRWVLQWGEMFQWGEFLLACWMRLEPCSVVVGLLDPMVAIR